MIVYIGADDDDDIHAKWDGPDAAIWHWEPAAKAILAFVQSDITVDNIQKSIVTRKQRATDRVDCFNTLNNLVSSVALPLLPDVLSFVSLALKGNNEFYMFSFFKVEVLTFASPFKFRLFLCI